MFFSGSDFSKPNPFLEPETIKTTELILERYGKHFRFAVSGFYNDINGLITQGTDPADGKVQFSNLQNVRGEGVEAGIEGRLAYGIESRVAYTLQNSSEERMKDTLPNSPRHLAK